MPEGKAEVRGEVRNHVALVCLARPRALNALTFDMLVELGHLLRAYAADPAVRLVVIRGEGDKAFCAGGDIRALYHSLQEPGLRGPDALHHRFFVAEYALDHALYSYPKPHVVLLDGITLGGGMGIAQGSRFRIVGERTRMGMPEVGIGLIPDVGASYFLSRLPGFLGMYLGLTAVHIGGADALHAGLADFYLPRAAIDSLGEELTAARWSGDPDEPRQFFQARATAAPAMPAASLQALRPAIDLHFSQPTVAALLDSLATETRPDYASWARHTAELLRSRSPTALCVTQRQLSLGRTLELAACFRMELELVEHCFEHGDFLEGVRALIVDKDNAPRWSPRTLDGVTGAAVDAFFRARRPTAAHPLAHLEEASWL